MGIWHFLGTLVPLVLSQLQLMLQNMMTSSWLYSMVDLRLTRMVPNFKKKFIDGKTYFSVCNFQAKALEASKNPILPNLRKLLLRAFH